MKRLSIYRGGIALALLLGAMSGASAANSFYAKQINVEPGETRDIVFYLENDQEFFGFQFDITLPEGLTPVETAGNVSFSLSNRADDSYSKVSNILADGTIRLGAFSTTHTPITGTEGELMTLKVSASDSFIGGEMQVSNIYFANAEHVDEELPDFAMNITPEHSNLLSVEDVQMVPGEEVTFSVALDNETQFSAFQMDIYMPEGLKIIPNSFILTSRAQNTHTCSSLSFEGGRTRVVCFSPSNEAFSGDSGKLFTFRFTTDENVAEKSEIQFKNILFSTANGLEKELPAVTSIVTVEVVPVEEIVLDPTSYSGEVGEEVQMTATVYPENATNKNVEWSSSDEEVVTVDSNGFVTLVGAGEAVIRATATDGSEVYAQAEFTANVDTSVNEVASMGEEHIAIYDLNGVAVYSGEASMFCKDLDSLNLPSGLYLLKTSSGTKFVYRK